MDDFPKINRAKEVPTKPRYKRSPLAVIVLVSILLIAIAAAGYFYLKVKKLETVTSGQDSSQALLDQVSKLIILPQDEQPTIATVTDTEKLKDQAFFANAQAGDKVIIYTTAKKAILFRPSENKIVEVAPLNINADQGIEPQ